MSNQVAIAGAIKLVVDAAKDVISASNPDLSWSQRLLEFENLIPDAMAELQVIGDIKAEIDALQPADIVSIAGILVADIGFANPDAQAIAKASLALLADAAIKVIPDVLALLAAIKGASKPAEA